VGIFGSCKSARVSRSIVTQIFSASFEGVAGAPASAGFKTPSCYKIILKNREINSNFCEIFIF